MTIPNTPFFYMAGGFLLGMFVMYNAFSLRTNVYMSHLQRRADPPNKVLMFGNPGIVLRAIYQEQTSVIKIYLIKGRLLIYLNDKLIPPPITAKNVFPTGLVNTLQQKVSRQGMV